jgi:hypothetical protein
MDYVSMRENNSRKVGKFTSDLRRKQEKKAHPAQWAMNPTEQPYMEDDVV